MSPTTDLGVRENSRLTALTGLVLFVLLALEGITILQLESMIVLHFVIGTLLVAPVLLKLATTGYKIVRYYTGVPAYVQEGPPPIIRRLLGPVVIVTSIGLFGSGVMLAVVGPKQIGSWLFFHKAFFVLWFMAMALHVLMHLGGMMNGFLDEYFVAKKKLLPGRGRRSLALLGTLAIGALLGAWALGQSHVWQGIFLGH